MTQRFFIFIILFFIPIIGFSQYISVDQNYTAQQLVEQVLFTNSCGNVTNVSVSGGNFGTSDESWGYFNANGSSFPIQEGIILSTGKIANAVGPNSSLSDDGSNMGWNGDSDLNQALGLSNSFNATVLEFDFSALSNSISFEYIFSSEQYLTNPNANQCDYTDGFAFLIKEISQTNYNNIALVPNTNIPVKVNTIRGNGTICPPANAQYFDAFNGVNHPTNYNGQTLTLTAQANVIPGQTYHIKLVIADEGNYRYDSAIFLKGGSFTFDIDLGEDKTVANENPVCFDEVFTLDASSPSATTYQWYFNGNQLIGETNSTLSFNPPYSQTMNGNYSVIIDAGDPCERNGNINLEFSEDLQINQNSFTKCDTDSTQDGITQFTQTDFTTILNDLFTNLPPNYSVDLFANASDTTPIQIPYENTVANSQIIYAKVTNVNCYSPIPITLNVNTFGDTVTDDTIGLCNGNSTILETLPGYTYLWNTGETSQQIIVSTAGNYSVTLTNGILCSVTQNFTVVGSEIATIDGILINDFSNNNSAEIQVSGTGSYEYSLDGITYQDSPIFNNLTEGEYIVYVNDKNDCGIVTQSFYILDYPKFFTPNNDGINDYWNIKNLDKRGLNASKIYIFDRYGKFLKQISPEGNGWNGNYNGKTLPSDDYWFVLEMTDGKVVKGNFSLTR